MAANRTPTFTVRKANQSRDYGTAKTRNRGAWLDNLTSAHKAILAERVMGGAATENWL